MLFDNMKDPTQQNNLVNREDMSEIQAKLDEQLSLELLRIGEAEINPREHYLKKFGYYGRKEFRDDYHIADCQNVKVVITPHGSFEID